MSRLRNFTHSLASGYLQIGVNLLYTFASIPLALHYLPSTDEFGLWTLATAVAGYLLLIDFGMSGAAARILIDHKDDPTGKAYGSVIKISVIVLLFQGLLIAIGGILVSLWLPRLVNVPAEFHHALQLLVGGLSVLQGIFFVTRIFFNLGVAHQRYDIGNYIQSGSLVIQFAVLWLAFRGGWGVYSLLAASGAGLFFAFCCGWITSVRLSFFPKRGDWGHFDPKLFKEIFFFGSDQFLMAVGFQLINASQVLIISHTLGLTAAAVWAVATKPFQLAQQFVGRIFSFSLAALAEMIVRDEQERFRRRFREIVIVSVAVAVFVAAGIALCNQSFLQVWTKGRIVWSPRNDLLLALWFVISTATTIHVGAATLTKQIGGMRYVYFCEGVMFVVAALFLGRSFGISGIIVAAIAANIVCSGIFGIRRTVKLFHGSVGEVVTGWMAGPMAYLAILLVLFSGCFLLTKSLAPIIRLAVNGTVASVFGLGFLWRVGLNRELRKEIRDMAGRAKTSLPKIFGSVAVPREVNEKL